jgi:hypothetical protein
MSTATTSTADQKAAKLLERADQLEQDTDQAADRIRGEWRAEQERLQRDKDLTREAVTRLAHEKFKPLKEKMQALRENNNNNSRAALVRDARVACFGAAPGSGDKLLAYRDARDRATAITDKQVCDQQVRRALDAGDELLAKAIAEHAHDMHWNQVATRAVPLELLRALAELERPRNARHERTREMFRWHLPSSSPPHVI